MSLNFVVLCLIYENSQFKKVTLKIKFPKTSLLFFFIYLQFYFKWSSLRLMSMKINHYGGIHIHKQIT